MAGAVFYAAIDRPWQSKGSASPEARLTNPLYILKPDLRSDPLDGEANFMREQVVVTQPAWTDLRPRCEDCHIVTDLRSTILAREGRQISVYQCSNCSRLVWRD